MKKKNKQDNIQNAEANGTVTKKPFDLKEFLINNALMMVMILIIIIIVVNQPRFLRFKNITNILAQTSTRLIASLGVAGLIVLAGTDLSAGRLIGITALISAIFLQDPTYSKRYLQNLPDLGDFGSIALGLFVALLVGAAFGLFNGFGVAKLHLHAFIATLGTQLISYGLIQAIIDNNPNGPQPLGTLRPAYKNIVVGEINIGGFGIPYLVIYAAIAVAIMWVVWNKTTLGKNMFAIGGNPEAAAVSGINVDKNILIIFLISGIMYAISGFLEGPRLGQVSTETGLNYDLDAISACVIGGVSFSGGVGKISGVVLGALILQIIVTGLIFVGMPTYYQIVIKGALIIFAVALDTRKYLAKK